MLYAIVRDVIIDVTENNTFLQNPMEFKAVVLHKRKLDYCNVSLCLHCLMLQGDWQIIVILALSASRLLVFLYKFHV